MAGMEHVEYVHTTGMSEADLEARLDEGDHGVLALADGGDAYAVPISYHYDGERVLLRISTHDADSEKRRYLDTTDTATFLRYDAADEGSWSIQVRGPVSEWDGDVDDETVNDWFPPFRLFDEAVEDVSFALYALEPDSVVGRETV